MQKKSVFKQTLQLNVTWGFFIRFFIFRFAEENNADKRGRNDVGANYSQRYSPFVLVYQVTQKRVNAQVACVNFSLN